MALSTRASILATAAAAFTTIAVSAQSVTVELIPGARYANDMSPDGRWVVGNSLSGFPYRLDRETGTLLTMPLGTAAIAVSDDGMTVLGNMIDPEGSGAQVAGIWREGEGWTSLGFLPNALQCPSLSSAYELSADGTVAVGLSWEGCSGVGFIWTEATGMLPLESLANGNNRASVVSADGTVIGGFAQGSFSRTPAAWDSTGAGELLDPPSGDALGEVHGLSDDGTVLLGTWNADAVRWVKGGEPEILGNGQLINGWQGIPTDIADDGTTVGFDSLLTNRRSWIRPQGEGQLRSLRDWAEERGAVIPEGATMEVAQAITTDGRTIIGHDSFNGAWIVRIEEPCPADLDGTGEVGFNDLLSLLAAWDTDGPGADLEAPTDVVDFSDLIVLLAAWGPCP